MKRPSGRLHNELRSVEIIPHFARHADGSCLIKVGKTEVLCTASVETRLPAFLRNSGMGWVTAEYGMLPRATHTRTDREAAKGRQSGRTQEIQRLIGRSLRAVVDRKMMGEMSVTLDCDVLNADGGTRCVSITGAYVALVLAFRRLKKTGQLKVIPITDQIAAVSCGILQDGTQILDLDYDEDHVAETDANFIMIADGRIVEIQATAEGKAFSQVEFIRLTELAGSAMPYLFEAQNKALAE